MIFCSNSSENVKFNDFSIHSRIFREIPRNFHQNRSKIRWKLLKNSDFCRKFCKNAKKFDEFLLRFSISRGAKVCASCRYIWVCLFFLSRAPRRLQTTHGPENRVSLLENRSFHERHAFYLYFSSANPSKSAKIGPRWL